MVESDRGTAAEKAAYDAGETPVFVPDSDADHRGSAFDRIAEPTFDFGGDDAE